jgi:hypothetical protein
VVPTLLLASSPNTVVVPGLLLENQRGAHDRIGTTALEGARKPRRRAALVVPPHVGVCRDAAQCQVSFPNRPVLSHQPMNFPADLAGLRALVRASTRLRHFHPTGPPDRWQAAARSLGQPAN